MMKLIMIVLTAMTSLSAFADNTDKLIAELTKYEGKTGTGSYTKNGVKTISENPCYLAVNNIDSWSSDYSVTADLFEITVGSKRLGMDLRNSNIADQVQTLSNGSKTYSESYLGKNKCNYSLKININKSKKSVSFSEAKVCKNGVKTLDSIVCTF